jgi:uncharacterized protein
MAVRTESRLRAYPPDRRAARTDVLIWAGILFGLTGTSAVLMTITGVDPTTTFSPAILLAAYAPGLAAIAVASARGSLRQLFRPMLVWRINIGWYALVLGAPMIMVLAANAIHLLAGGRAPASAIGPAALLPMLGPLIVAPMAEEIGWRGFAQPRLQVGHSALVASVIIGLIWATWHQWPILAPGGEFQPLDVAGGYLRLVSTAILYGWLLNSTGSLLLVVIAHIAHNLALDVIPTPVDPTGSFHLSLGLVYLIAALLVIWRTGGRLGSHNAANARSEV